MTVDEEKEARKKIISKMNFLNKSLGELFVDLMMNQKKIAFEILKGLILWFEMQMELFFHLRGHLWLHYTDTM